MPVTINGTTGIVTPAENTTALTVGSITGILKATSGVVSQATAGSDYGQLTLATAQNASGTAVDFTGIPSWVKRITVMFSAVSTNGSSIPMIQIGSGSVTSTGYESQGWTSNTNNTSNTTGFIIGGISFASYVYDGIAVLTLLNATSNLWVISVNGAGLSTGAFVAGGNKTLSGTLDRVRITTVNGIDTFDAGTINISYE